MINLLDISVDFSPLLPLTVIYGLAFTGSILLLVSLILKRRGSILRAVSFCAILLVILNPSIIEEEHTPVPDILGVIADFSPSQSLNDRKARTQEIMDALRQKLADKPGLEIRLAEEEKLSFQRETRLFETAEQIFADVPPAQRAGLILITDGQVHDAPEGTKNTNYGPIHVLLTGQKNEFDRRIVMLSAPSYGLTGKDVKIRYRIEDTRKDSADEAEIILSVEDEDNREITLPVNIDQEMSLPVKHAGANIFSISLKPVAGEITDINNRLPLTINGVRDRLRVLLVSGQPYTGERVWRDLLSEDPGVDLVHFTILREPQKIDSTPQKEMSLIPFPFDELFDKKLSGFDLIIFDRYRLNSIMPDMYFTNISNYVKRGGAFLEVSGPYFAGPQSIFSTEISSILPASPQSGMNADIIRREFRPTVTDIGQRHPVTRGLNEQESSWGAWHQMIRTIPQDETDILMTGAEKLPLLLLSRVEKGRVAQITSDQIWLWARGHDHGGPHHLLLQRLAHWLMKEPELEENNLQASMTPGGILVRRHSLDDAPASITLTDPQGKETAITLEQEEPGAQRALIADPVPGLYKISDGVFERMVLAGDANALEFQSMTTTDRLLLPAARQSKGSVYWDSRAETLPDIRGIEKGQNFSGNDWIGWRKNGSYVVTGSQAKDIMMPEALLPALLGLMLLCWWNEGRKRRI